MGLEDASEPRNPVVSRELARGWLANPRQVLDSESDIIGQAEAKWLLVFDNADKPDILQDYCPLSGNGSVLITSRDPLARTTPSIASLTIDIEPFQDAEAAAFLQQQSKIHREEEYSLIIARKLGGLLLALSQMAAIIRYQYLSYSEFLARYEDEPDRRELLAFEAGVPRQEARGNVASIWAIEQLDTEARTVLELCSILDPDCIQERIFTENFAIAATLSGYPTKMFTYADARASLIQRSLVKRNEEKKEFSIHRVLQDSVRVKMSRTRMLEIFTAAVAQVRTAWGTTSLEKRHVLSLSRSREGLFPHALSLKSLYEILYKEGSLKGNVQLASLLNEAGWYAEHIAIASQTLLTILAGGNMNVETPKI